MGAKTMHSDEDWGFVKINTLAWISELAVICQFCAVVAVSPGNKLTEAPRHDSKSVLQA